jgi:alkyl hydroperoxide reductase subunit D
MTLEQLAETIPAFAKDLKLNLSSVTRQTELTEQQLWGTVLACALASRNSKVGDALAAEAAQHLSPQAAEAAKTAMALMSMNNVYYRFTHLSENEKYSTIPARLRMNGMRTHGVEPADFELWCIAVSAVNGCGACITAHQKVIKEKGVGEETILAAVRIASVIQAIAVVLDGEPAAVAASSPAQG